MTAERNIYAAVLAVLLAACPDDDQGEPPPECLVETFEWDIRRLPVFVPAKPSEAPVGESKPEALVTVALDAPKGTYELTLQIDLVLDSQCAVDEPDPVLCRHQKAFHDVDFKDTLSMEQVAQDLGDFTLACANPKCEGNFRYGEFPFVLTCEQARCQGELRFFVAVDAEAHIDRQGALIVSASLEGDVCEEPLPFVDVTLDGWEEPSVRDS